MSCFWTSIISAFSVAEFQKAFPSYKLNRKPQPKQLIELFKKHNRKTQNVKWNGEPLSSQEMEENKTCIKEYNSNSFNQGHWCSTCDPFLLLTCELFNVNIRHQYLKTLIVYSNENDENAKSVESANKTIVLRSNRGHITFLRKR